MSEQIKQAEALVSIALETYTQEIVPELTSSKRYTGAMVANALGIAKKEQRRVLKEELKSKNRRS